MTRLFNTFLLSALLAVSFAAPSLAQITFLSNRGDVTLPMTPPPGTGGAGAINNMTLGVTTPAAGAFTTLSATGAISGAGFTARLATPGPIGNTVASTGAFSTLSASGAVSGAGITALFASPPAIGGTAAAAGAFTTASTTGLATLASAQIDTGTKTAAATGGAATLAKNAGVITTEALTTAAGATYTLTLTNSTIAAVDQVFASVAYGTATAGMPVVTRVTPGASSVVIVVQNIDAAAALDGTLKISFARFAN